MAMKAVVALAVIVLIWASGLLAFTGRVAHSTPPPEPEAAEGIVALTGGSDLRLRAAEDLLENGAGQRLLVSGVNRKATRTDLLGVTGAVKSVFDCCVDLGFSAANTIGNAREAAEWARSMHYRSLILVTADYHMPRAILELHAALPEARITPYPVATPALDARRWLGSGIAARRMVVEYCKFLAILGRQALAPRASA